MSEPTLNREGWLHALTTLLRPLFETAALPIPEGLAISVGFPSTRALSPKKKRIGEHWHVGGGHIFISPLLADPYDAAAVLVHELLHAALPAGTKHRAPFVKGMKALGLAGKPTATIAGPELTEHLKQLLSTLPPYPHAGLEPGMLERKVQKSRQLKLVCPNHSDYIVRASQQLIDRAVPLCGECHSPMAPDGAQQEEAA